MKLENKGKICIRHGKKNGDELIWSSVIGEGEYLYPGEAKEALEDINWETAEQICNQKLNDSYALLFELFVRNHSADWEKMDERLLLYFIEEERDSVKQAQSGD